MHFDTKSYLKSTRNHTVKHALRRLVSIQVRQVKLPSVKKLNKSFLEGLVMHNKLIFGLKKKKLKKKTNKLIINS
jgi:hypothetical protein